MLGPTRICRLCKPPIIVPLGEGGAAGWKWEGEQHNISEYGILEIPLLRRQFTKITGRRLVVKTFVFTCRGAILILGTARNATQLFRNERRKTRTTGSGVGVVTQRASGFGKNRVVKGGNGATVTVLTRTRNA